MPSGLNSLMWCPRKTCLWKPIYGIYLINIHDYLSPLLPCAPFLLRIPAFNRASGTRSPQLAAFRVAHTYLRS